MTLVCDEAKWIYIHPPRTGGTSVSSALIGAFETRRFPLKHARLWDYDIPASYFKFMTVRNPWDRIASLSAWYAAHNETAVMERCIWAAMPLEEYGLREMDFVLRHERLAPDFKRLCKRLGIEAPALPTKAHYQRRPCRDYFTPQLKKAVAKRFAYEIERFKYEF